MPAEHDQFRKQFHTGVVILSLDTEQIWGYLDQMNEMQFRNRYPDALETHERLLACLTGAGVSATWFVGVAWRFTEAWHTGSPHGRTAQGLTERIRAGSEDDPLWYRPPSWSVCAAAHTRKSGFMAG